MKRQAEDKIIEVQLQTAFNHLDAASLLAKCVLACFCVAKSLFVRLVQPLYNYVRSARRFDVNNDRVLDEVEQKALVSALGAEYGDTIAEALASADEDHDGKIDAHEIAKMLAVDTETESDGEVD